MCCFSQRVEQVSRTQIFARRLDAHTQGLVYEMNVTAAGELAMVLPLPTDPAAGEGAVTFVDLSKAPYFFASLRALFPMTDELAPQARGTTFGARQTLAVHRVGDFEASFVPTPGEFERLDPRFRLAPDLVSALTARETMGFAVFQLRGFDAQPPPTPTFWERMFGGPKSPVATAVRKTFHPMGLKFRTRDPSVLFLPTVHVHDGSLPATADFDHVLYAQCDGAPGPSWERSVHEVPAHTLELAAGMLDARQPLFRREITGAHPNHDTRVPA